MACPLAQIQDAKGGVAAESKSQRRSSPGAETDGLEREPAEVDRRRKDLCEGFRTIVAERFVREVERVDARTTLLAPERQEPGDRPRRLGGYPVAVQIQDLSGSCGGVPLATRSSRPSKSCMMPSSPQSVSSRFNMRRFSIRVIRQTRSGTALGPSGVPIEEDAGYGLESDRCRNEPAEAVCVDAVPLEAPALAAPGELLELSRDGGAAGPSKGDVPKLEVPDKGARA